VTTGGWKRQGRAQSRRKSQSFDSGEPVGGDCVGNVACNLCSGSRWWQAMHPATATGDKLGMPPTLAGELLATVAASNMFVAGHVAAALEAGSARAGPRVAELNAACHEANTVCRRCAKQVLHMELAAQSVD
jgi:hypothetical protein